MSDRLIVVDAAFGAGPFTDLTTATWTNLGTVRSAEWTVGRDSEFDPYPAGQAVVVLENKNRRLDPDNTASPFFGDLLPRVPVRIRSQDRDTLAFANEFVGYVAGGWEQVPSATMNDCRLELVDLLGALSLELPDVFEHTVLSYSPSGFWILDQSTAETVADLGSGRNDGQVQGTGVTLGDRVLAPGHRPAALFETVYVADEEEQWGHVGLGASPVVSSPAAAMVMATFQVLKYGGADRTLFVQSNGNGSLWSGIRLRLRQNGELAYDRAVGGSGYSPQHAVSVVDGNDHVVFGFNQSIRVDTTVTVDSTLGSVDGEAANGVGIGGAPGEETIAHWHGWVGAVAVWPDNTTVGDAGRAAILAAYDKLNGDRTDQQIAWALDVLGVPANMRTLGTGTVFMGPADAKGHDALEWVRQVTATEQGEFYVDHRAGGKLRFRDRYARHLNARSNTSQVTFDDRLGIPATIPYSQEGLDFVPNDLGSIVNTVTVKWRDGEVTVTDQTSKNAYGPRPRSVDTQATTADQARSVGEWLVARRKDPMSQVRGCTSSARAMRDRNDKLQALEVGDRVTFRIQPGNTGTVTTRDLWVEGITHRCPDGATWETSVRFSPADTLQPWLWGTGLWGTTAVWG